MCLPKLSTRRSLAAQLPSCSKVPAHMEFSKLSPLGPDLGPLLRRIRSWSPALRLRKSRPDVGWVCSCYKFLHIKKKSCACQNDKACFPFGSSVPKFMARVLKGSANPFNLLGQQTLPSPMVWPWALPHPGKGTSMSVPKQRYRSDLEEGAGGRRGRIPGKRHFCCWLKPVF